MRFDWSLPVPTTNLATGQRPSRPSSDPNDTGPLFNFDFNALFDFPYTADHNTTQVSAQMPMLQPYLSDDFEALMGPSIGLELGSSETSVPSYLPNPVEDDQMLDTFEDPPLFGLSTTNMYPFRNASQPPSQSWPSGYDAFASITTGSSMDASAAPPETSEYRQKLFHTIDRLVRFAASLQ
jgi:hypothetical protein